MSQPYVFQLFVAGDSARNIHLYETVREICVKAYGEDCDVTMIDVLAEPGEAENNHILATPTLVRQSPLPRRLIIGDLTQRDRLMRGLDISSDTHG